MDNKGTTLGIGAAVIGIATAVIGALLAGKSTGTASSAPSNGAAGSAPSGSGARADQATGTDGDGPSGHTAPAQPAPTGQEGHAAPDLAGGTDLGPAHRAPDAFRPDIDAPMTAAEREALRPATGPTPSLVSPEGAGVQGVGGDRY